ncbi:hypothetical protein J4573_09230 [Actinomadura barringtoniae]|uniref:Uncharacterized protein n=1 Tax=Actinomadura barringtoniae TaxID=1427535 RepID=A0A939T8T6_9ACTN|nr:hypothetical protein [Actinomadura barringtoniae]MBO2447265.1 hypothetical protein [Actinomadura barringtoniae]
MAVIALSVGLATIVFSDDGNTANKKGDEAPKTAQIIPSGNFPRSVITDADGVVSAMPDLLPVIRSSVPHEVTLEGFNPDNTPTAQDYVGESFNRSMGRKLSIVIKRLDGLAKAKSAYSSEVVKRSDRHPKGRAEGLLVIGNSQSLHGLGDEAFFSTVEEGNVIRGYGAAKATYDLGGGLVACRTKNILVEIVWEGMNYLPDPNAGQRAVRLSSGQAKKDAQTILVAILNELNGSHP